MINHRRPSTLGEAGWRVFLIQLFPDGASRRPCSPPTLGQFPGSAPSWGKFPQHTPAVQSGDFRSSFPPIAANALVPRNPAHGPCYQTVGSDSWARSGRALWLCGFAGESEHPTLMILDLEKSPTPSSVPLSIHARYLHGTQCFVTMVAIVRQPSSGPLD